MKRQIGKALKFLKGTSGESLMESIISILVFIVLIAAVTLMILVSLRITSAATHAADIRQAQANAVLTGLDDEADLTFTSGEVGLTISGNTYYVDVTVSYTENFIAFKP